MKSAYLDGVFDLVEFKNEKEQIEKSINDINNEISSKTNKRLDINAFRKRVIDVYSILHSETATTLEKNSAIKTVLEKIVYNKSDQELEFTTIFNNIHYYSKNHLNVIVYIIFITSM